MYLPFCGVNTKFFVLVVVVASVSVPFISICTATPWSHQQSLIKSQWNETTCGHLTEDNRLFVSCMCFYVWWGATVPSRGEATVAAGAAAEPSSLTHTAGLNYQVKTLPGHTHAHTHTAAWHFLHSTCVAFLIYCSSESLRMESVQPVRGHGHRKQIATCPKCVSTSLSSMCGSTRDKGSAHQAFWHFAKLISTLERTAMSEMWNSCERSVWAGPGYAASCESMLCLRSEARSQLG